MTKPLALTYDFGTQSVRALLVDMQGNIVAKQQVQYDPYYSIKEGWCDQSPNTYWNSVVEASNKLAEQNSSLLGDIIGVTITTMRDTCICLDKNGEPLIDFIVWTDEREAKCEKPMPLLNRLAFRLVGMQDALEVQRKLTKANWIQENMADIWQNTHKFVLLTGWLTRKMVGKFVDSTANQISRIPFDYKNKKWKGKHDLQIPVFNVPQDKLVDLVDVGGDLGILLDSVADELGMPHGLMMIASGSDIACSTLGTGVVDESGVALSFGTTSSVQLTTSKYVEPLPLLPSYPSVVPNKYNPEIQVRRGYWLIRWFRDEFGQDEVAQARERGVTPEEIFNEHLPEIPCGSLGLVVQPYWLPALKSPEARGSIIGFNGSHTKYHLYRAIVEGIGYALYDGMHTLVKRSGARVKFVTVAGGGSQSDYICQMTADLFGLPVKRIQTYEASGIGSSIVAFVAKGHFASYNEAVESMVHHENVFNPNEENHEVYMQLYHNVYKWQYRRLKPLYVRMRKVMKKLNMYNSNND